MTPGERFDQDEVLRFGDPWHGLYRNGVIELPNATTRAPAGAPSTGSSFAVQIPGQPAVTTSPEDAAQGMTWLNYAIMTGDDHKVYGRSMDNNAWIFIDPNGVPWRAVLEWTIGLLSVKLYRFGLLNTAPAGMAYSASVGFSLVSGGIDHKLVIDDVDSGGRQVALVYFLDDTYGHRDVERVFLLTLSGSGASFSVEISDETPDPLVASTYGSFGDHDGRSIWVRANGTDVSGPYVPDQYGNPSGFEFVPGTLYEISYGWPLHDHYWNSLVRVVGATLINDNFALVLGTTYAETDAATTVDMDTLWDHYLPDQVTPKLSPAMYQMTDTTGNFKITLNGIDTDVPFECHSEQWQFPPFGPTDSGYQSVDGYHWNIWGTLVTHVTAPAVVGGHAEPVPYSAWLPWLWGGDSADYAIHLDRNANHIYRVSGALGAVFCVCGPNNSVKSESFATDSAIRFATAHPISGNMVTGPTPVCWV